MPIPLFVLGAKCKYTFSAQNLPPGLKLENNLITGKVLEPGSWNIVLTAFPSNFQYPVLQTTIQVTAGEKITREVIQDIVVTQDTIGNIKSFSVIDLEEINSSVEGNIHGFSDVYIDVVNQSRISATLAEQKVSLIGSTITLNITLNKQIVFFCGSQLVLGGNVQPLINFTQNFIQNNFLNRADVNNFSFSGLFSAQFINQSQATFLSLGSICSSQCLNQSQVAPLTSLNQIILTQVFNNSNAFIKEGLIVISTQFLNQSQGNLVSEVREKLQLIESTVRNFSQANLNT